MPGGLRRIALTLLHVIGRAFDRIGRACLYASAALSRLDDLKAGVPAAWNDFLPDDERIGAGWMPWERAVAERVVRPGQRVLVVGCGSGRDVIPFLERGCLVVGVDPAPAAIAAARRALAARHLEAPLTVGFFEDLELSGPFDTVWFSWFAYSYIPDASRRVAALRKAAGLLTPDGHVVVSIMRRGPQTRMLDAARALARVAGSDWQMARGDIFARIAGTSLLRYEHYFEDGEAEAELAAAGLHVLASAEALTVLIATAG